jgi:protease PrsW
MFYTLIGLALAPGIAIMLFIYWRDTHEKEPMRHLLVCLILGMFSVIPALLIERLLTSNVQNYLFQSRSVANSLFKAYVVAAVVEEMIKFSFCRLYAYPKRDFNEPLDGIVYMVMVALGFATVENFMYIFSNTKSGFEIGIVRMFIAVPGHACWGVIIGYFMGQAKFKHVGTKRITVMLTGLLLAMLLHGTYDGLLFLEDTTTFRDYTYLLTLSALATAILSYILAYKAIARHRKLSALSFALNENETDGISSDC